MLIKNNKLYFENKQEQERMLKELQNRWQALMNTCKGIKNEKTSKMFDMKTSKNTISSNW